MKILIFVLTYFITSLAEKQDLSGKMFSFLGDTGQVTLVPDQSKNLTAISVCLRFYTDLSTDQCLFSFATTTKNDEFSFYIRQNGIYAVEHKQGYAEFFGLGYILNAMNSVCLTWDSKMGVVQISVNGKRSTRKGLGPGKHISSTPRIAIGKNPYSAENTAFTGMLAGVNMWDSVISFQEIFNFMNAIPVSGNLIQWRSLELSTKGYVIVEDIII